MLFLCRHRINKPILPDVGLQHELLAIQYGHVRRKTSSHVGLVDSNRRAADDMRLDGTVLNDDTDPCQGLITLEFVQDARLRAG